MREAFEAWSGLPPGSVEGWEFIPHKEAGELAAVAALRGTEIHFAVAPGWRHRVIQRSRTRAFLAPLIERAGFLTTRSNDMKHDRFLTGLGFVRTWSEGAMNHYMLTELPFGEGG